MTPAKAVQVALFEGRAAARHTSSAAVHSARRRAAVAVLVAAGWSVTDVATALDVSRAMAYRLMVPSNKQKA